MTRDVSTRSTQERSTDAPPTGRMPLASTVGAVLAAILASACCWLPLALLGTGVGALGVSSFFEAYRPVLLGSSGVLLAIGFYTVYLRPRCAPGDACAVPNRRIQRSNRVILWVATVVAILSATFPDYVGWFLGGTESTVAAAPGSPRTYAIEGMTCEACATHLRTAIDDLPGVRSAEVSFEEGRARVWFDERADDEAITRAVELAGYRVLLDRPAR